MAQTGDSQTSVERRSLRYSFYVLTVVTLVGVVSWMDRSIVAVLLDQIKQDFHLSDTQMGLVTGFGFSILYALAAIPVARLADRSNRRTLIAIGVMVWSAMTLLGGLAHSVLVFVLARLGVGASEVAGYAPAQSLLTDYFTPRYRALAFRVQTQSAY